MEYKFRAKTKFNGFKEFKPVAGLYGYIIERLDLFTGDKDINGKDIYENDYDTDGNCVVFCDSCKSIQFSAIDIESKEVCVGCHNCDGNFMYQDHIGEFKIIGSR